MSVMNLVLEKTRDELIRMLYTEISGDDLGRTNVIKIGFLQGDPDPDEARVSVTIFPNDPDQEIRGSAIGHAPAAWDDTIFEEEVGSVLTWSRKYTVKARCLFTTGAEADDEAIARGIAATIKQRLEKAILKINYGGISSDTEFVCRSASSSSLRSSFVQSGGPGAYDFYIKVRFDVLTTTT